LLEVDHIGRLKRHLELGLELVEGSLHHLEAALVAARLLRLTMEIGYIALQVVSEELTVQRASATQGL
jgi:hypothetical protein